MTTINKRIAADGDDGSWNATTFSNGLPQYLNNTKSFYRFTNVDIPTNATVRWASMMFQARNDYIMQTPSGAITTTASTGEAVFIQGVAGIANPVAPTGTTNANSYPLTTQSSRWDMGDWKSGLYYQTNDMSAVVQELIDDASWASGQHMMFYLTPGATGGRQAWSHNESGARSCRLDIDWYKPTPPNVLTWGWNNPVTVYDSGGSLGGLTNAQWSDDKVRENNGQYANFFGNHTDTGTISSYLICTDFGFNIPTSSTIYGIEARIQRNRKDNFFTSGGLFRSNWAFDNELRLLRANNIQDVCKAKSEDLWTNNSNHYEYYGGSGDLWGITDWSNTDINHPGFGLAFRGYGLDGGLVDHVQMKVHYSAIYSTASGMPLFIHGHLTDNSGMNLYIGGTYVDATGVTLYTSGFDRSTSGIPLFTVGGLSNDGNIPLYTSGPPPTGGMNLFIKADDWTAFSSTSDPTLFTHGTPAGTSGAFAAATMYCHAANFPGPMNLFIQTDNSAQTTSLMNLYIGGEYNNVGQQLGLYISNSGIYEDLSLYIRGLPLGGGNDPFFPNDGYPAYDNMNLYIDRNTADAMTLFCFNSADSGILPLYVQGGVSVTSNISLVMPSTIDRPVGNMRLYTHGF